MTLHKFHIALLVCALMVPFAPLSAAESTSPNARFTITKTQSGYIRLDAVTGGILHCAETGGDMVCKNATGEASLTNIERDSMLARLEVLEDRVRVLEEKASKNPILSLDDADLDKTMEQTEKMMRRFFGMMKNLKDDLDEKDRT